MRAIDATAARIEREIKLRDLANKQFGLLRHDDLTAEGLDHNEIRRRLQVGRLTRMHERVYAFGHSALTERGHWLAALWAAHPGVVLSHLTAAVFHGMRQAEEDEPIHLSTPRGARSRDGVVVHRVRYLDAKDVFRPLPLRVTTIPRTVVDLADVLPWAEFRAAVDELPYLHLGGLKRAYARAPGRRGTAMVLRLIEADDRHTKSEFERKFLRFCRAHSIPRPDDLNQRLAGHKADCLYYGARLVVELDGRSFHSRRSQMRSDRRRDFDYQVAGYRILRLLWDDLHVDSARDTEERIRRMLALVPA